MSESKLFRLAEQGKLQPDDMLWKPGFETWKAASTIPGLLSPPVTPGKQDVPPRPRRSHVWEIGLGAGVAAGAVAAALYWILVSWVQVPNPDQKALLESLTRLSSASAQGVNLLSFSELLLDATTKYKIAQSHLDPSGPISDNDFFRLAEQGNLKPDDLLWKRGFEGWKAASSIPGLLRPPETPSGKPIPTTQAGSP